MRALRIRSIILAALLMPWMTGLIGAVTGFAQTFDDFTLRLPPTETADGFAVTFELAGAPITVTFTVDKDEDIRITNVEGIPEKYHPAVFRDHINLNLPGGDDMRIDFKAQGVRDGRPRNVRVKGDFEEDEEDDDDDEDDEDDEDFGPCEDPDDSEQEQDECEIRQEHREAIARCNDPAITPPDQKQSCITLADAERDDALEDLENP